MADTETVAEIQAEQRAPEVTEAELSRARKDAARYRQQRNETNEKMNKILEALNLLGDDVSTDDPEKLTQYLKQEKRERARAERELKEYQVSNLLREVTDQQGANYRLTRAVLVDEGKLKNIDLSDTETARQDLADLVTDAITAEPSLVTAPGAPRSSGPDVKPGADISPDNVQNPQALVDALWERGDYAGIIKLQEEGKLGLKPSVPTY